VSPVAPTTVSVTLLKGSFPWGPAYIHAGNLVLLDYVKVLSELGT